MKLIGFRATTQFTTRGKLAVAAFLLCPLLSGGIIASVMDDLARGTRYGVGGPDPGMVLMLYLSGLVWLASIPMMLVERVTTIEPIHKYDWEKE